MRILARVTRAAGKAVERPPVSGAQRTERLPCLRIGAAGSRDDAPCRGGKAAHSRCPWSALWAEHPGLDISPQGPGNNLLPNRRQSYAAVTQPISRLLSRSLHDHSVLTLSTHPEYTADCLQALESSRRGRTVGGEPKHLRCNIPLHLQRRAAGMWIARSSRVRSQMGTLAAGATFKLVAPTVHVADDVVRSAILLPVVPERLTPDSAFLKRSGW